MKGNIITAFFALLLAIFSLEFAPSAQARCWLKLDANVRTLPFEAARENIIFKNDKKREVVVKQDMSPWNFLLAVTRNPDNRYPPLGWVHRTQIEGDSCRVVTNYTISTPREWVEQD